MSLYDVKVPPIGNPDALIMALGESPGKNEAREREPFVGDAGSELDKLLRSIGESRESVWITNTVKFLPTEPKHEFFFNGDSPSSTYMEGILELIEEISGH
jgi:DNA polymerase